MHLRLSAGLDLDLALFGLLGPGQPDLQDPVLVAGWPGMGLVAFRAVSYLLESLDIEPLAEFEPLDIYPLRSVAIEEGVIESARLPHAKAYHHQARGSNRDLVIFLGEEQPVAGAEWRLSNEILELASGLGVRDVFTFAAMVTHIDHKTHPRVWGCATRAELTKNLESAEVAIMQEGQVSGLNGVLLGVARHKGMNGYCLLGELPYYLTQVAYPRASCAVLEAFCQLVGTEIDLSELRALGLATLAEIDTYFEQIKSEVEEKEGHVPPFSEEPDEEDEGEGMLN